MQIKLILARFAAAWVIVMSTGCERYNQSAPPDSWSSAIPDEYASPCRRGEPNRAKVVTIDRSASYPCVIKMSDVIAQLRATVSDSFPPPDHYAWLLADGRYVTGAGANSKQKLLVWGADGTLVRSYDKTGEGPGELPGGHNFFILSSPKSDSLYVVDRRNIWSVFTMDLRFVRSFSAATARSRSALLVMSDGTIVSAGGDSGEGGPYTIHTRNLKGELLARIKNYSEGSGFADYPAIAASGPSTFWVTPRQGTPGKLSLEEWTTSGELLRTIHRVLPGAPEEGFRLHLHDDGAPLETRQYPEYPLLWVDETGLIWVGAVVSDWALGEQAEARVDPAVDDIPLDLRLEVIDPDGGVVLASAIIESVTETPFDTHLPGTQRVVKNQVDELGFNWQTIFQLHLQEREP